ncbi:hypothetical protein G6F31_018784 [Rhizopus arrhizus]|nr:hypothetical protein G6F31_018784 [Rhizopus arrhizus]
MFTFDPGFMSTAACESGITYIDGDKGVLLYRGYPIEQLSEKSSYVEVAYLLINGERPSAEQLKAFTDELAAEANVDASINTLIGSFAKDAHPMAILTAAIAQLVAAIQCVYQRQLHMQRMAAVGVEVVACAEIDLQVRRQLAAIGHALDVRTQAAAEHVVGTDPVVAREGWLAT